MSKVKHKDTSIELFLRSKLHKRGLRFRNNVTKLPGSPDIVLAKYKVAIFVHGCFWHGHNNCAKAKKPITRIEYWFPKIENNKIRDANNIQQLLKNNWRVAIVWGCSLQDTTRIDTTINSLFCWITQPNLSNTFAQF